jgi:hypothetical protein
MRVVFTAAHDVGLNGATFKDGDFEVKLFDANDDKMIIQEQKTKFGTTEDYEIFEYDLMVGGQSGKDQGRRIEVSVPADGTLSLYVRTPGEGRNVIVMQNGSELYNEAVFVSNSQKDFCPIVSVPVVAGTVVITFTGNMVFACFQLTENEPTPKQCAAPTVAYTRGKLTFSSTTPGATFYSNIADGDIGSYQTSEVNLSVTYTVSVYAEASGYERSETTWVTLCWIDATPVTDIQEETTVEARPVLIESRGGMLTISGLENGTPVSIYGSGGQQTNKAVADSATLSVDSRLARGSVAIVKMGDKAVKIVVR